LAPAYLQATLKTFPFAPLTVGATAASAGPGRGHARIE
jgi:hypothetical protein